MKDEQQRPSPVVCLIPHHLSDHTRLLLRYSSSHCLINLYRYHDDNDDGDDDDGDVDDDL